MKATATLMSLNPFVLTKLLITFGLHDSGETYHAIMIVGYMQQETLSQTAVIRNNSRLTEQQQLYT